MVVEQLQESVVVSGGKVLLEYTKIKATGRYKEVVWNTTETFSLSSTLQSVKVFCRFSSKL